jgi:type IV secretory pathway VirB4 component
MNTSHVDTIAPERIEVDFNSLIVDGKYMRTYFIAGYPRFVSPNWLQPLIDYDNEVDISFFIYPTSSDKVLPNIQRKIAEMEATITSEVEGGKQVSPTVSAALEDAFSMQEMLAKGVERFFQLSLYIRLSASSKEILEKVSREFVATCNSMLLKPQLATLQMEEGLYATLPMAQDRLSISRNMDTTSLASMFPFSSSTLTQNRGILYGINQLNQSLIIFDRFSLENANEVVFGKSGSGKSYLIKLEILRSFMLGTEVIVIDPENEYQRVAEALGGEYVLFSANTPVSINPFDLSGVHEEGSDELGLNIQSIHALLKIALGEMSPRMTAVLDRAIVETYASHGITNDPSTQNGTPPVMKDLYDTLMGMQEPEASDLGLRLERFITGSLKGLFTQQTNFDFKNPLTVFCIRDVEDALRPLIMHLVLDFVWTRVRKTMKRRLLILDEAWYLMRFSDSAAFVQSLAKRARKYQLGLTTATQDVADFVGNQYGKAVLSNSSLQILLKQGASAIDELARVFYLSAGEQQRLLSANTGEGLFFAGQNHVAIRVVAAPFEHTLITTQTHKGGQL